MKLLETIVIKGILEVKTGLHIGGIKESFKIGGLDSPVIRIAGEGDPYIPGSSLKGKIRFLLEKKYGDEEEKIRKLFGPKPNEKESKEITRIIFRDCYIKKENLKNVTEIKPENTIDRNTLKANPRFIERVVPGTKFEVELVINFYEKDDKNELLKTLKEGLELLQENYLGGSGSRGYGKVDVSNIIDEINKKIQ